MWHLTWNIKTVITPEWLVALWLFNKDRFFLSENSLHNLNSTTNVKRIRNSFITLWYKSLTKFEKFKSASGRITVWKMELLFPIIKSTYLMTRSSVRSTENREISWRIRILIDIPNFGFISQNFFNLPGTLNFYLTIWVTSGSEIDISNVFLSKPCFISVTVFEFQCRAEFPKQPNIKGIPFGLE